MFGRFTGMGEIMDINKEKIEKMVKGIKYYDTERFIQDSQCYVTAIKEGRVIVNIESVSRSGMSRRMKFLECHKMKDNSYHYFTFFAFFTALGYSFKNDTFKVSGCGMDMVFMTNYNIIHQLAALGLVDNKDKKTLAQLTPTVI